MEFNEVIYGRKTIRKYSSKEVSNELIIDIIKAAQMAPSAKNRQPWRFYILNEQQKNHICDLMYQWDKSNRHERTSVKGSANQMKAAQKVIIIYSPIYKSKNKNIYYKKADYLSLGAAIENMSLKCVELGLGSCWCADTLYLDDEIDQYLNIENHEQISALLIGYPESIPETPKRFDINDLIIS